MFFLNQIKFKVLKNSYFYFLTFLTIVFFLYSGIANGQSPYWTWASSAGGTSSDYGNAVCNDDSGNTYVTGYFSHSITFGNITLTDVGGSDIFLVKYDPEGNVIWANSYGGGSNDFADDMTIDVNGHVIITGDFQSESITFDSFTLNNPNTGNGARSFFVAKIDSNGSVIWAYTASGDGNSMARGIDTDLNGNIVVTGSFDGLSLTFGTTTLTNFYQFATDIFLVKYNSAGEVLWAQSFGGNTYDSGTGVAIDNSGNINLIGSFLSNSISFGVTSLTNFGGYDYFIVQFSSDGNLIWIRNAPGDGNDFAHDIDTDSEGNIFVSGNYAGTYITFEVTTLPGNEYDNIFILKYNSGGNIQWIHTAQGNGNDEAYSLATDIDGSCLVTGAFESSTLSFEGAAALSNSSAEYSDIFVVKITADGVVAWALAAGGTDDDYALGISTNNSGNTFISGIYYSTMLSFGDISLVNADPSNNSPDYFIAKLNSTVGVDQTPFTQESFIYPNPVEDIFAVKVTESMDLKIYSNSGKLLYSKEQIHNETYLDISSFLPGIYHVLLVSDKEMLVNKLVKH